MNFYLALLVCFVIACTPKTTQEVVETKEEVQEIQRPEEPSNPCTTLNELSAAKRDEVETAYVLYKDLVKQKNYIEAFPLWEKAYYGAPAANGSIKYQFEDGLKIYKDFYDKAETEDQKKIYYDSIQSIYTKRGECFPEPGYLEGRRAFDMYYYYPDAASEDEIYSLFKKAVDAKGEKVDYFVVNPFTKLLSDRIISKSIPLDEGQKYTSALLDAIDYGTSSGKNKEAWGIINDYAPARLENLEGIKGLYECSYFENKYYAEFLANPSDCDVISRTAGLMLWGGCTTDNEKIKEIKAAKATHCYTPPPEPGPLRTAYNFLEAGQYPEAIEAFDKFVSITDDAQKKAKYTLVNAKIYYANLKNFSKARKYALDAAGYRGAWGEPYILIGKLYASSGPLCGPGRGWESQIVTWAAIDKFEYAKKIDPATAQEANKWINTYKQYMPTKEDVFFRQLKTGQSFTIPCWIQEKTTIRTSD